MAGGTTSELCFIVVLVLCWDLQSFTESQRLLLGRCFWRKVLLELHRLRQSANLFLDLGLGHGGHIGVLLECHRIARIHLSIK